jgi:SAM-dependent methyltransferase
VTSLDHPDRADEIRATIERKPALRRFYLDLYARYRRCLNRCPKDGIALELGSGAGFAKQVLPELVTSDVLAYKTVDRVVDATRLPFPDDALRGIFMVNVFHHIPDVAAFLREAERCLKPGGRVLIVDQNLGWISTPILKYAHHEPFLPHAREWAFETTGPLSGANGALAWMVFERDLERVRREFPKLRLERWEPHTPLRYWLAGGLKPWSLLPGWAYAAAAAVDRALSLLCPRLCSFVDIELVRVP